MEIDVPAGSKYKLWLHLEIEIPEEHVDRPGDAYREGEEYGLLPSIFGTYDTIDEALDAARSIGCELEF